MLSILRGTLLYIVVDRVLFLMDDCQVLVDKFDRNNQKSVTIEGLWSDYERTERNEHGKRQLAEQARACLLR